MRSEDHAVQNGRSESTEKTLKEEMEYKGFRGSIEYSATDNMFYGKVLELDALVSYEGVTRAMLEETFKETVDDYLRIKAQGKW